METIKTLVNLCPVPMVILDEKSNVLLINKSFSNVFGYTIEDLPDVDHWFERAYPTDKEYREKQRAAWRKAAAERQYDIDYTSKGRPANVCCKDRSVRIVEIFGANIGEKQNLIVFIDNTEREKKDRENELLIQSLNQALAEVNTLRGILPLCSFCKKIRNDKGYWEQVDIYIAEHSQAMVSHSLCPDCFRTYYPVEYEDMMKNKKDNEGN